MESYLDRIIPGIFLGVACNSIPIGRGVCQFDRYTSSPTRVEHITSDDTGEERSGCMDSPCTSVKVITRDGQACSRRCNLYTGFPRLIKLVEHVALYPSSVARI